MFSGVPIQTGHGLGNVLNSAFRLFLPAIKSAGKAVLREGLATGVNILGDVVRGQNIKRAAKKRLRQGGERLLTKAGRRLSGGKRKTTSLFTSIEPPKKKKKTRDIFD